MSEDEVEFEPYKGAVDISFWEKLIHVKLDVVKSEETELEIVGKFLDTTDSSRIVTVDESSFDERPDRKDWATTSTLEEIFTTNTDRPVGYMSGSLVIVNSAIYFTNLDRDEELEKQGARLARMIHSGEALERPYLLNRFYLVVFADLKRFEFGYWFAFPSLDLYTYTEVGSPELLDDIFSEEQFDELVASHATLGEDSRLVFGAYLDDGKVKCCSLKEYIDHTGEWYLCMVDSSTEENSPGWQLRNLLALVAYSRKTDQDEPINVVCFRMGIEFDSSFVIRIKCEINYDSSDDEIECIGWEEAPRSDHGVRVVNLRNSVDPTTLAVSSVDLNLKLMKWRIVPDLDLDIMQTQKCLILGSGTLGCSVARCLLGWGVRSFTFVDHARVLFSNPVRQCLFEYNDCHVDLPMGAKFKAKAASAALKRIFPGVKSKGVVLSIPMPSRTQRNFRDTKILDELIEDHDVVFILTDTKESCWLPTVIAAAKKKLAITINLGFDTYLVMRHGIPDSETGARLGCYFCNDVTAPTSRRPGRTLDQSCTVTRPGVSNIAASMGVELFVSILQHEKKGSASAGAESRLGTIPHSIRGIPTHFQQICTSTPAFSHCTGCSPSVTKEYLENRDEFMAKVFNPNGNVYLENLTGLTELHKEPNTIVDQNDEDTSCTKCGNFLFSILKITNTMYKNEGEEEKKNQNS